MAKTIKTECFRCGKVFLKLASERKRCLAAGLLRDYCSRNCAILANRNSGPGDAKRLVAFSGNRRDEDTPFRYFQKNARSRRGDSPPIPMLRELWKSQNGICPLTGWTMVLPERCDRFPPGGDRMMRASLDRIDCHLGYVEGNLRFVCYAANLARNNYGDAALIKFCQAVARYSKC